MNDLAVVDPREEQRLKEKMGVVPEAQSNDRVCMVKINLDDEDEAGNQLPRGTMYLRDHSEIAYAKNIKIRVLGQH